MQNVLELRLVDVLVDFLGLSMFINASLPEIYYLMKTHSVRFHLHNFF